MITTFVLRDRFPELTSTRERVFDYSFAPMIRVA